MDNPKNNVIAKIRNDTMRDMSVEVCSSFNEVSISSSEWDDFVASVDGEIYSTYDWCSIWWKHYGSERQLYIYIFRYEGYVVGIVPLFMEKIR